MNVASRAAYMSVWVDALEGFTPALIAKAFAAHMDAEPSVKPNPGHIKAILKDRWGRHVAAKAKAEAQQAIPAPGQHHETREERRLSAARAMAILAEAGGGLRSAMNAQEAAEADRKRRANAEVSDLMRRTRRQPDQPANAEDAA